MADTNERTVTISASDIERAIRIIDVVCQRGAIQGNEMFDVGALRNKLGAYLKDQNPEGANAQAQPEFKEMPEGTTSTKVVN
jgi:hypothetical protein